MKKIIATVLAMVMALALCTTAFAADTYKEVTATDPLTLEKVFIKEGDSSGQYYIKTGTDKYRVATDAETAVIKAGGYNKAPLAKMTDEGYLFEVYQDAAGTYYAKAAVVDAYDKEKGTAIAQNSVVYFGKDLASAVAYYAYNSNTNLKVAEAVTVLYKTTATFGANKAAVYTNLAGTATYALVGDVDSTDKDKDAVGNLSKIFYERPNDYATLLNKAGKDIKLAADSGYYYVLTEKAASTTTNTNKPSPKTFDAGIAMYVGMALTSVAGSALVIGKKKEF